jgi:uncharacterized protein YggT (Ycf19 family)
MRLICVVLFLLQVLLFASAVLSWFPVRDGFLGDVKQTLARFTDPVLEPVRKIFPFLRMGGIDFTTMAVLLLLSVVRSRLCV